MDLDPNVKETMETMMQTSSLKISLVSRHQEDTMDTTRTQTHIQAQTIFFQMISLKHVPQLDDTTMDTIAYKQEEDKLA